jgi:hypothetical protein
MNGLVNTTKPNSRSSAYAVDYTDNKKSSVAGNQTNSQSKKPKIYKVDDVVKFNDKGKTKEGIIIKQNIYSVLSENNKIIRYLIVIYDAINKTFSERIEMPENELNLSRNKYDNLKKPHYFAVNETVNFKLPNAAEIFTGTIVELSESKIYRTYDIQGNIPNPDGISATRNGIYLSVPESDITRINK